MTDALHMVTALLNDVGAEYAVIGGHAVNAWLEPRFTADVIANRTKDQADLAGLVVLQGLDWDYIERRCHEWDLVDRLEALKKRSEVTST